MRSQADQGQQTLAHLSENVRAVRLQRGLSQAALSTRSGISRRMITGIESGVANVSLATVDRLASALEVPFSRLVRQPDDLDSQNIRKLAWRGRKPGSQAILLGAAPAGGEVEMWTWQLAAGERYVSEAGSEAWHEMIYVVAGELTLRRRGSATTLGAGDFSIFSSSDAYEFVNLGNEPAQFVRTIALHGPFTFAPTPGKVAPAS